MCEQAVCCPQLPLASPALQGLAVLPEVHVDGLHSVQPNVRCACTGVIQGALRSDQWNTAHGHPAFLRNVLNVLMLVFRFPVQAGQTCVCLGINVSGISDSGACFQAVALIQIAAYSPKKQINLGVCVPFFLSTLLILYLSCVLAVGCSVLGHLILLMLLIRHSGAPRGAADPATELHASCRYTCGSKPA